MLFKEDTVARAQHMAVRENVGWYRWTHDLLEVTGSDATRFLDLLYVNSIGKTAIGRSKYTTALDENGKIIDDVIVFHLGDETYWVSTLYIPELKEWIEAKRGNLDVQYRDLTEELDMFSITGPNARKLVNLIAGQPVDDLKYFSIKENTIGGASVKIHRSSFTGELGFEIYCEPRDTPSIEKVLVEKGAELGAVRLTTLEVYVRGLAVEKGYVLQQDICGLSPLEADLAWSVDLSKDFIGKEAVEQEKAEGTKRKLIGVEFDVYNDIAQGEIVYHHGVQVGYMTAATYGYTVEKYIGYAVLDTAKAPVGSKVTIGPNKNPGLVVEKVWYDPEGKRARA